MRGLTRAVGAALACLLAAPAWAADPAVTAAPALAGKRLEAFCTGLSGVIAEEAARERADFAPSLDEAVAVARAALDKRVTLAAARADEDEGAPAVEWQAEDALAAGRYLWQRWVPTSPADDLTVVADLPGEWRIGPTPGPDPAGPADPIRVDKRTGKVTWHLPHPSERERLYDRLCGAGAGAGE